MKEIKINFKKDIFLYAKVCNWFEKISGLMFSKKTKANALLFKFKNGKKIPIHSWFVFFDFLAVWTNSSNKIIEIKIVKPFKLRVLPEKEFTKLLEIPLNKKYSKISKKIIYLYKKEGKNLRIDFSDDKLSLR